MPVRRQTFRIEESLRSRRRGGALLRAPESEPQLDVARELRALQGMIAGPGSAGKSGRAPKPADVEALRVAIRRWRSSVAGSPLRASAGVERLRAELDEIVRSTERAASGILDAAERVDQTAQTLAAGLQRDHERGLANDIREQIAKIFETCHFQDIAGQRAMKVSQALDDMSGCAARTRDLCDTLERSDANVLRDALTWDGFDPQSDRSLLNGPRLTGDPGHCAQSQIDVIFDS